MLDVIISLEKILRRSFFIVEEKTLYARLGKYYGPNQAGLSRIIKCQEFYIIVIA